MKRGRLILLGVAGVVAVVVVSLVWTYRAKRSTGATLESSAPAADQVLAVDDLKEKPERFTGKIRVLGVVGGTKASEHLFGLIDKREVEACGTTTCAEFLLPVRWQGTMPKVGDEVTVTGVLNKSAQGLLLEAAGVDPR